MSKQIGAAKNRKYSPTKLQTAVNMVESGAMTRRKASIAYGVPRTTLLDKLSGRYKLGTSPGRKTVLTHAEELNVVEYCKLMASIGYPLKKDELLFEVKKVLDHDMRPTPFKNNYPGKDWFYGFCKRHPSISQRTAMALGHQRALINKDMIAGWFTGLQNHLEKEVPGWQQMIQDPRRCFNADESGFPLCVNTGKVLAEKGARHVYQVSSSTKQQLTVMVCFNAYGHYLPPLIVFPGERFRDSGIHEFEEAIYGQTPNGWMDSALFVEFLKHLNSFVNEKSIQKPVILYVDGHSTHMSLEASTYCHDNGIVLYCLFPNATHVLQPCDVGFFGPMKSSWKKEVKEWHLQNVGQSFTKKHFPSVFKKAWLRVTKLENAIHGFQRCGLFPLCPNNVDLSKLTPSTIHAKAESTNMPQPVPVTSLPAPPPVSVTSLPAPPAVSVTSLPALPPVSVTSLPAPTSVSVTSLPASPPESVTSLPVPTSVSVTSLPAPPPESVTSLPALQPVVSVTSLPAPPPVSFTSLPEPPSISVTSIPAPPPVSVTSLPAPPPVSAMSLPTSSSISVTHLPAQPSVPVTSLSSLPKMFQRSPDLHTVATSSSSLLLHDQDNYISPSFSLLTVPEIRPKKSALTIRQKLPKALSGTEALKMLKEREDKKQEEELAKLKRKEEREKKKKQREEEKLKRIKEREEKKRIKEELKKTKELNKLRASKMRKRKRQGSSSSSESDGVRPIYADYDDDCDEMSSCPGCRTDDGAIDEWVRCSSCPRKWHISCTGDNILLDIPTEHLAKYPFVCEECMN